MSVQICWSYRRYWLRVLIVPYRLVGIALLALLLISSAPVPGGRADELRHSLTVSEQAVVPMLHSSKPRQWYATWIATVANIDWPSRPGLPGVVQQQQFRHLLDEAQHMRMNAVIVQIRPVADAFYPSRYGPWSQYLTGVQGKDPGYDPLAFMVSEAHKRGLEFHAWFNPYRVSMQADIHRLASEHPARQHPDWLIQYGGKLYYNPGLPAVREFIVNSILEVVQRYPIDAVHLDDYFYPYPVAGQPFPDRTTYQRYGAAKFPHEADWRRDNVNRLLAELSARIKTLRPHVRLGVSPFGVWRNQSVDPAGSATHAGVSDYDDLYADTHSWIKHNWIDYIVPQIYWPIGFPPAAYEKLIAWWSKEVAGSRVQLYVGQAAYRVSAWHDPDELLRQLQLNQRYPAIKGSIFFSIKDMLKLPAKLKGQLISSFLS